MKPNTQILLRSILIVFLLLGMHFGYTQQLKKLPKTKENRLARIKHEQMMLRDPTTGKVPHNIREKELNYVYSSKAHLQASFNPQARTNTANFKVRGPFNVGGRTRAVGVDQRNPKIIMIGSASGGLFRTTDGGASWTRASDIQANPAITGIAQDPTKPDTWYYITGESLGGSASALDAGALYLGDGVFKSTDNGVTWNQLASTKPVNNVNWGAGAKAEWQFCHDIEIDPIDGAILVANIAGVYRSTDGGATWTKVIDAIMSAKGGLYTGDQIDIDVVKTSATTRVYYAATHSSGNQAGCFTSTNGLNWTNINNPRLIQGVWSWNRIKVAIAPSQPNIVWFFLSSNTPEPNTNQLYNLHAYDANANGGAGQWYDQSANLPNIAGPVGKLDTQGGYDMVLEVKPDNPNYLFLGGTCLYRSSDGFNTPLNVNNTGNTVWIGGYSPENNVSRYKNHHPDVHALVFMPGSTTEVLCGHDGGLSKTADITTNQGVPNGLTKPHPVTWIELNNGYYATQAYSIAIDPTTKGDKRILLGFQDNGNWSVNSTSATVHWDEEIFGGDGSYGAIVARQDTRYFSTQNGVILKVTGTNTLQPATATFIHPKTATQKLFINPFVLDKNDQSIMYYPAGNKLWRHNAVDTISNRGDVKGVTDPGWIEVSSAAIGSGAISAIATSKVPANIVYYGTSDGQVYKLTNANNGNTPTRTDLFSGKGLPAGAYVSCITVDEDDANKVFVTFANYGKKSIFYSANGGNTWTDVGGNLEEKPDGSGNGPSIRWASILKLADGSKIYYIGASTGLYSTKTLNGTNTTWTQEGANVMGNVPVTMMKTRAIDGLVAVGTHGRGAFSANVGAGTGGGGGGNPTVTALSPANNATRVTTNANLVITFNESVVKGSGNILIKKKADNSVIETIDVTSNLVTISNTVATINPANDLVKNTAFYVEIAATAFKNKAGKAYAGMTGNTQWTFATIGGSNAAPIVTTFIPANNAVAVATTSSLVLTFDKNIVKGSGNILIKKSADNSVVETIDVTSAKVTIANATVTIDPANNLAPGTKFYVEVAAGAFKSAAGNAYAGITGNGTWSFTTARTATAVADVLQQALKVYPNPSSSQIAIRLEKLNVEIAKVELYNLSGKLVEEKLLKSFNSRDLEGSLNVSKLSKGMYILKVITPQHIISRTLVVQ